MILRGSPIAQPRESSFQKNHFGRKIIQLSNKLKNSHENISGLPFKRQKLGHYLFGSVIIINKETNLATHFK
jgi:hypothetical protein